MAEHDNSYKLMFSHRRMVVDLLQGFVHQPWVARLDLRTLKLVNRSYVTEDARDREDDLVWRVRLGGEWLYVYLLFEFQSTVERFMSVRVMEYEGLIYQDLIRSGAIPAGGYLPPLFPVVLYNGTARWTAPRDVGDLVAGAPGGLEEYRPRVRYLLLAENEFRGAELPLRNLVAALFRMELSRNTEELRAALDDLIEWIDAPGLVRLRRAFTTWLRRALLPRRFRGIHLVQVEDLQEVKAMLAEHVEEWTRDWREQGIQQGRLDDAREALADVIEVRFGGVPTRLREQISRLADMDVLRALRRRAASAGSLAEFEAEAPAKGD